MYTYIRDAYIHEHMYKYIHDAYIGVHTLERTNTYLSGQVHACSIYTCTCVKKTHHTHTHTHPHTERDTHRHTHTHTHTQTYAETKEECHDDFSQNRLAKCKFCRVD